MSWLVVLRSIGARLLGASLPVRGLLLAGWMAGIWSLSSRSTVLPPHLTSRFWAFLGNLAHAPAFGLLCLFLVAFLSVRVPRSPPSGASPGSGAALPASGFVRNAWAFMLTIGYGFLDEWHQSRVAGRHSTLSDVLLDGLAALCVLWVAAYLGRPDARERALRKRLGVGVFLCVIAAWLGVAPR